MSEPVAESPSRWGHVARGVRIVSLCTLLSRVLGLLRDSAMAALFGNGAILDAFTIAFRIPNLARVLLGEGALTTAMLPAFVKTHQQFGLPRAWQLLTAVSVALLGLLGLLVLAGELVLLLSALGLMAWGSIRDENLLLIELMAIMLPYVILICLAAQANGALQGLSDFARPALVPAVLNLLWLAALLVIARVTSEPHVQIRLTALSVVLAGMAQCWVSWDGLRRHGYRVSRDWRQSWDDVGQIGGQMLPVVLGLSITQINTLSDSLLAWWLSAPEGLPQATLWPGGPVCPLESGTASALYFGQRLYQFPLGVFGVALGTVLFPLFSQHAARGDRQALRDDLGLGLRLVLAVGVPATAGLMLIAHPLATTFFQYGRFTPEDAAMTGGVIRGYGFGVWAFCGLLIVQRAFYAVGDRQTPLKIGIVAVLANMLLNVPLLWFLGASGLALATSIVAGGQFCATTLLLDRAVGGLPWRAIGATILRVGISTAVMIVVVLSAEAALAQSGVLDTMWPLARRGLTVLIPLALAIGVYLLMAVVVGLKEPWELISHRRSPGDSRPERAEDIVAASSPPDAGAS